MATADVCHRNSPRPVFFYPFCFPSGILGATMVRHLNPFAPNTAWLRPYGKTKNPQPARKQAPCRRRCRFGPAVSSRAKTVPGGPGWRGPGPRKRRTVNQLLTPHWQGVATDHICHFVTEICRSIALLGSSFRPMLLLPVAVLLSSFPTVNLSPRLSPHPITTRVH